MLNKNTLETLGAILVMLLGAAALWLAFVIL
jgi:hypothetical protein